MRDTPQTPAHALTPPSAPAPDLKRRRFLLAVSAGSAGAVAAASPARATIIAASQTASDDSTTGYRETAHVRDYYATTRL